MNQTNDNPRLAGEALRNDPRIAQARALILEAVGQYSRSISGVRPADPSRAAEYQQLLDRLGRVRGGKPFWPYLSSGIGNGPLVELADGSVKLDFISGIGVHGCGHSHEAMIGAAVDAALEDTLMQGNLQQHTPTIDMCQRLLDLATTDGANLDHCLLSTSGAMANENAMKIALHHQHPASRVIAFEHAFAGRTLAMASLTDKAANRQGLPVTLDVDYLPFLDPEDPEGSTRRAVEQLHRLLARFPDRYAAFWAEPIAGEGGYYAGSHDFFRELCDIFRQAQIPIVFDEVQSFSRSSKPFAFQHYGLDRYADIVTVGKITQVCATLYGTDFKPKAPILSQTFTGSSSSIAAGLAMIDQLESNGCFGAEGENVQRHRYFADALDRLQKTHPNRVRGPYGEGMMIAFTPGDGSAAQANDLMSIMFDVGLLGFVCGSNPTRIRFLPPPATTTRQDIDLAIELLEKSLELFAKKYS